MMQADNNKKEEEETAENATRLQDRKIVLFIKQFVLQ